MAASPIPPTSVEDSKFPLNLLFFIDKRPSSVEQVRQIRQYLSVLEENFEVQLDVVDFGEQPYLAEHYKLVASPALIKISPPPQQILAGSNIAPQLERWWPKWLHEAKTNLETLNKDLPLEQTLEQWRDSDSELSYSAELMKLSDEIFRLKQLNTDLESQLRFKNRIISMMAHDLRNPLTAASIAVETLEMGYAAPSAEKRNVTLTPELTQQLLKHAKTQIRAIDRMITDILKAAKGAFVNIQLQPQELNLRSLCLEVLESLANQIDQKQLQVSTDIPQDLPTVYADPIQVRRVVANLLDNAVKYTPNQGKVSITALHRTTEKVQVTIQDTGPGIPEESLTAIFEESYRLQRDQGKDGYGLGLALCQRIIRAHYGQIWVDSVPSEGSYFYFTLPVYRA